MNVGKAYENFIRSRRQKGCLDKTLNSYKNLIAGFIKFAGAAKELGLDYFATTLTISPLKNASKLNEIGEELADTYHVRWLPSDFKKKNGYKRSTELSHEYGMYRQDYCGCVFSYRERHPETVVASDDAPLDV